MCRQCFMRTLGGNKIHVESHQVDTWWFQCILLVTRLETGIASISRLTARSSYLVPEASSSLGAKTCEGGTQIQMCSCPPDPECQGREFEAPVQLVHTLNSSWAYSYLGMAEHQTFHDLSRRMLKDTWSLFPASPASQGLVLIYLARLP